MAIKTFKEIIDNKGYRINPADRKIFEESDIQSFFGVSENDLIEFVLYDVNDNQLLQGTNGLVRYIPLTNENIKDYFLLPEGTLFQKYKFPSEYFIDVNRLVKEAGYDSGIFKTQVTLLNKRLGSFEDNDKVWIQEISPSRTEIRVLPHKKGLERFPSLSQQYNAFVNNLDFRDDTVRDVFEYIEKINPSNISNYLKTTYTENWVLKLQQEYKINLDIFCTEIYSKFIEGVINEFTNRISNINDINYGKPKTTKNAVTLSKNDIKKICERILVNVLNKYMIIPNVSFGSVSNEKIESAEAIEKIIKTKTSDLTIDIKKPIVEEIILTKEKPPLELVKETKLKDVIADVIKDDIIITKDDIIPADEIGIVPVLEPPIERIVGPRRFLGPQRNIVGNPRGAGFFDMNQDQNIDYGNREIVE